MSVFFMEFWQKFWVNVNSYLVRADGTSMYSYLVETDSTSMYSYLVEAGGTSMTAT